MNDYVEGNLHYYTYVRSPDTVITPTCINTPPTPPFTGAYAIAIIEAYVDEVLPSSATAVDIKDYFFSMYSVAESIDASIVKLKETCEAINVAFPIEDAYEKQLTVLLKQRSMAKVSLVYTIIRIMWRVLQFSGVDVSFSNYEDIMKFATEKIGNRFPSHGLDISW